MSNRIVEECLEDFKYRYYETGRGDSPPLAMYAQLSQILHELVLYNWGTVTLPGSSVTGMKVHALTKQKRRLGIFIECRLKYPKGVSERKMRELEKDNLLITNKHSFKICKEFSLTDGGSRKGWGGPSCMRDGRKWLIDGHPLEKVRSRKLLLAEKREKLIDCIGKKAFDVLKRGGPLQIWRNSTPHSGEGKRPTLSLFTTTRDSEEKVSYFGSWFSGPDAGQPIHSKYILKREYR